MEAGCDVGLVRSLGICSDAGFRQECRTVTSQARVDDIAKETPMSRIGMAFHARKAASVDQHPFERPVGEVVEAAFIVEISWTPFVRR